MDDTTRDRARLAEYEQIAAAIVERAAALLLERYRQPVEVEFKDRRKTDPVTAVDRAIETLISGELRRSFPDHDVLGEENVEDSPSSNRTSEYLWVLDPLDGTANFAGRLPFFGISLALLRRGAPVVGCLFVPFGPTLSGGVMRASWGNGASVGGEPLRLERRPFQPAYPVALPPSAGWVFKMSGQFARRPGEIRNLGSISAELAMVAGGGFQYAAFFRPKVWDVAAGALIIREAGGEALVWGRGRWRRLVRFLPPSSKQGRPTTLRDWGHPVLVGAPETIERMAHDFRPRPFPPLVLRWLERRKRAVRRWWRARKKPASGAPAAGGEGVPPHDGASLPG